MAIGDVRASAPGRRRRFALLFGLALLVSTGQQRLAARSGSGDGLTPQERRGKDIYFGLATGERLPITARIGDPPVEAPPTLLACANCHGSDGRGKREGGVVPSDITWEALTKPYGVTHPGGRTHGPYTDRLLVRAIGLGIDPDGNRLHPAMPRFQMSHVDSEALTLYLKRLSTDSPAGVSDSEIRLGTILPTTGALAEAGRAVESLLTAYCDSLNKQGGIYGRTLTLSVTPLGGAAGSATGVETLLRDNPPFAVVGGLIAGADTDVIALTEGRGVPFVGPLTSLPRPSGAGSLTFYLLSGIEQQARALGDYRRTSAPATGLASVTIVHSAAAVPRDALGRVRDHYVRSGWSVTVLDREGLTAKLIATELKRSTATHVLMLVDAREMLEIANDLASNGWILELLVPGALATNDLLRMPPPLMDRVFLALPSVPSDQTPAGLAEYRALAETYRLPPTEMKWQLAALGSAKVLVQGLKLAGRELTRPKLVAALEQLSDFDSGVMPRIRFGRTQRIGASGAYIVTLDPGLKQFRLITGWLPVD